MEEQAKAEHAKNQRARKRRSVCVSYSLVYKWYSMVLNKQINENDGTCTHTLSFSLYLFLTFSLALSVVFAVSASRNVADHECSENRFNAFNVRIFIYFLQYSAALYPWFDFLDLSLLLLVVHCRQYYYNIVTTVHYC